MSKDIKVNFASELFYVPQQRTRRFVLIIYHRFKEQKWESRRWQSFNILSKEKKCDLTKHFQSHKKLFTVQFSIPCCRHENPHDFWASRQTKTIKLFFRLSLVYNKKFNFISNKTNFFYYLNFTRALLWCREDLKYSCTVLNPDLKYRWVKSTNEILHIFFAKNFFSSFFFSQSFWLDGAMASTFLNINDSRLECGEDWYVCVCRRNEGKVN